MGQKSMMEKVRVSRLRPPEATPREKAAWQAFLLQVDNLQVTTLAGINPLVAAELERLVGKGNPIAIRFKERLSAAFFEPRKSNEKPKAAPTARRISDLKWGKPADNREKPEGDV